jgi:lariat debranching enzyme
MRDPLLFAVIGDIHGRFQRVESWLQALEKARGHEVRFVLAVGDVEAFSSADDHRRKAAKRSMPAEFAEYASGQRRFPRPLLFIGGNNEDFAPLDPMREGGTLAPNVHYLGRAGVTEREGLHIAYLSGIYAPKFFDQPVESPTTLQKAKQRPCFPEGGPGSGRNVVARVATRARPSPPWGSPAPCPPVPLDWELGGA